MAQDFFYLPKHYPYLDSIKNDVKIVINHRSRLDVKGEFEYEASNAIPFYVVCFVKKMYIIFPLKYGLVDQGN